MFGTSDAANKSKSLSTIPFVDRLFYFSQAPVPAVAKSIPLSP